MPGNLFEFLDHVMRSEKLEHIVITGMVEEK